MRLEKQCIECFRRNYARLSYRYRLNDEQREEFEEFFETLLDDCGNIASPVLQRELQNKLARLTGDPDPFSEEKKKSNQLALKLYRKWKPRVEGSDDPFGLAMRLALAGNIMDYAALKEFDLSGTIDRVISARPGIDHSHLLRQRLDDSKQILYLGDNAGEIVFDRLFIETMDQPGLRFAVRGGPAINDATMEDAIYAGLDEVTEIISTGVDIPSVIPAMSSREFNKHFLDADLIIAKGQGNLEGLIDRADPRIFFLFMVKCDVIARRVGVPEGSIAVYNPSFK